MHGRLLMARLMWLLWPRLTSLRIAPVGPPRVRTRCFPAQPPHLPLRANQVTSLCCASSSRRIGLDMRFLFISSRVSPSLPSHGRLPFRSWLQMVVFSFFHVWFYYRGLTPHLQRAHAGHTQCERGNPGFAGLHWDTSSLALAQKSQISPGECVAIKRVIAFQIEELMPEHIQAEANGADLGMSPAERDRHTELPRHGEKGNSVCPVSPLSLLPPVKNGRLRQWTNRTRSCGWWRRGPRRE